MGFFNLPVSTGLNFIEEGAFIGAKAQWYDTINFGISDTGYNSPNLPLLDNVDFGISDTGYNSPNLPLSDNVDFGISDTGYNSPNLPLLGQITNSDNVDLTITESVTT